MADVIALQLGDFAFSAYEIPANIRFGGKQRLATHLLVGGARVVEAMGRDDAPITWSGIFVGANALGRARYLDYLRAAGGQLKLTWSEFSYTVVIEHFECSFERTYQLPYSLALTVVSDDANPVLAAPQSDFDSTMASDAAQAAGLSNSIGDGPLSGLMTTLNTAITAVSSFANAAQATISSVLTPIAAVQARVSTLITSTTQTINNVTSIGGVLPNNPVAALATNLTNQAVAVNQLPQLYNLQSVLGRMGGNLGLINTTPNARTVTVAGGNLFAIASQQYGDPTKWTAIAAANGMTDPAFTGVKTLIIPPHPSASGGVVGK